jgi:parallel beta-helix repeat protein
MKNKILHLTLQLILIITILSYSSQFYTIAENTNPIIVEPGESIQNAINNASEGQTIYIKKGTYTIEETIFVNKTLTLIGEKTNETIIDGQNTVTLILNILASNSKIYNLTIRNSETSYGIGIQIKDATNIEIKNNNITNCNKGINLRNANYSIITMNLIKDNSYGIRLEYSFHNKIFLNDAKDNEKSIYIELNSNQNLFYHNNLNQTDGFGVSANYWNITYPGGGNYWASYLGDDFKKGPYQNETGSDGIIDDKYNFLGAIDHHPFLGYIEWEIAYKSENIEYLVIISNNASKVTSFNFNPDEKLIQFNLTKISEANNETNLCRVIIPQQLLWVTDSSWQLTIDNQETNYTCLSDENSTYFCFTNNSSYTQDIVIKGTHAIPEFTGTILTITLIFTIIIIVVLKTLKPFFVIELNSRNLKNLQNTLNIGEND